MKHEFKDFIGIFNDVYPEGFCEDVIETFKTYEKNGKVWSRKNQGDLAHEKNDYAVDLKILQNFKEGNDTPNVYQIFMDGLSECFNLYKERFSILEQYKLASHNMKVQRTLPGGGYHIWHAEDASLENKSRVLVYSLYCNTLESDAGGETEFLYQKLRVPPIKNSLIIFPGNFTHAHRGNTVLGQEDKYIVTGWIYGN